MQKNNSKKHLVIVSTWFPPLISVAVNRIVAFAKYLSKDNFEVSIITLGVNKKTELSTAYNCQIYRVPNNGFFKEPSFNSKCNKLWHYTKVIWKILVSKINKDAYKSWRKEAAKVLESLHKTKQVDVLLSSFAPISAHLVALDFCTTHPEVLWVADMRDEMSDNPDISSSEKHNRLQVEKAIAKRIDVLSTVSNPILNLYQKSIPNLKKYVVVKNGFDHNLTPQPSQFNAVFTLSHCGVFYGKRNPFLLFKALTELQLEGKMPKQWCLNLIGLAKEFDVPQAIIPFVKTFGRVTIEESLAYMHQSDCNVLIQPYVGRVGVYTGKLFDYLSVHKPILAIIDTTDVAAELIKEVNGGYIAKYNDLAEVKTAILDCVRLWENKEPISIDTTKVALLHRKHQVAILEAAIQEVYNG